MPFSFSTALSGLRASSNALGITGNNIANANTTAFKSNSATFADVFVNSLGTRLNGADQALQVGSGVALASTTTNFSQGTLIDTGSATSAAIQGSGFFIARDVTGAYRYTRAGDFTTDRSGFLMTPSGLRVQGYASINGQIPAGAAITDLQFPIGDTIAPVESTTAAFRMNLNSQAPIGSQFHAPVKVYDSKGVARSLDLVFTKQGSLSASGGLNFSTPANTLGANETLTFTFVDQNGSSASTTVALTSGQTVGAALTQLQADTGLQAAGITTSVDGSGNLKFTGTSAFSVVSTVAAGATSTGIGTTAVAAQPNSNFQMLATVDGVAAQSNGSSSPVVFSFNSSGVMTAPSSLVVTPDQTQLAGATLTSITVEMFKVNADGSLGDPNYTSYAAPSSVTATAQDGFAAGALNGFSLSSDRNGTILATFTNGQTRPIGRLALASFSSNDGLRHIGGNFYGETIASGQPSIGEPGNGGRGEVFGGALEQSNVDIASELTEMIVHQRGFQANSRVITSINQTLQDLLQIF